MTEASTVAKRYVNVNSSQCKEASYVLLSFWLSFWIPLGNLPCVYSLRTMREEIQLLMCALSWDLHTCLCQSVMDTMQSSVLQICTIPLHWGICTSCVFITWCSNKALLIHIIILLCRVRDTVVPSSLDNDSCCAYSNHDCDYQEREAKMQVNVACIPCMAKCTTLADAHHWSVVSTVSWLWNIVKSFYDRD